MLDVRMANECNDNCGNDFGNIEKVERCKIQIVTF